MKKILVSMVLCLAMIIATNAVAQGGLTGQATYIKVIQRPVASVLNPDVWTAGTMGAGKATLSVPPNANYTGFAWKSLLGGASFSDPAAASCTVDIPVTDEYWCTVTTPIGPVDTNHVLITVYDVPTDITVALTDDVMSPLVFIAPEWLALEGGMAVCTATLVDGANPPDILSFTFSWLLDGNPMADVPLHISGSATDILTINPVATSDERLGPVPLPSYQPHIEWLAYPTP